MFASLFLAGRAGRLCVAIFNDKGAIRTPCLGLVGARLARHTRGAIASVRIVPDWAHLAFLSARIGPLSRGAFCGVSST